MSNFSSAGEFVSSNMNGFLGEADVGSYEYGDCTVWHWTVRPVFHAFDPFSPSSYARAPRIVETWPRLLGRAPIFYLTNMYEGYLDYTRTGLISSPLRHLLPSFCYQSIMWVWSISG